MSLSETTKPVDQELAWVVVCTRPMSEELAEKALRQVGYRVYLPRYRKVLHAHGSSRRGVRSMRPRFPGYLFAETWIGWPNESIRGVIGLMRVAGSPAQISDQDIHKLMGKEWRGEFDDEYDPMTHKRRFDLIPGQAVTLELGGQRLEAIIDDLDENGKAIITAMIFGRATRLSNVDQRELEAVDA